MIKSMSRIRFSAFLKMSLAQELGVQIKKMVVQQNNNSNKIKIKKKDYPKSL